jgi:hypothetical protein
MDGTRNTDTRHTSRRTGRSFAQFVPVVWIVILLALWLVIANWRMLPDLITGTMAALP